MKGFWIDPRIYLRSHLALGTPRIDPGWGPARFAQMFSRTEYRKSLRPFYDLSSTHFLIPEELPILKLPALFWGAPAPRREKGSAGCSSSLPPGAGNRVLLNTPVSMSCAKHQRC